MKVKIFTAPNPEELENAVNAFIAQTELEVVEMQYTATGSFYSVMVTYETVGII